ncbi:hypothetical protein [Candidatus Viridilinea mediisalina]|uniref:Uncharacterized protein n=1 Tax=Candidatus Viridilinea mediisalina TaxID=2024553 RepID=A0A2A6RIG2_9CHLR|nr:hypothetical protein [Candidatus Viridilinea mediisalina]PDW02867.1 hypothetical protein CJ255_11715 [Candidatus Viridilinea mediisalina]
MEIVAILLLLICYGLAAYLAWLQRTPLYLLALGAGHLSALALPLWHMLYGARLSAGFEQAQQLLAQAIPMGVILGSGWYYPLPAIIVLLLWRTRWWFPGYLAGFITFFIFSLYHLVLETIGLRTRTWSYEAGLLPWGLTAPLLHAFMAAVISYGLLYVLLATNRFSWQSLLVLVLPAGLGLSLLVHGLLGAPFWVALIVGGPAWMAQVGLFTSLALLLWASQIITSGFNRLQAP